MRKVETLLTLLEGLYLPFSPLATTADNGMVAGVGEDLHIQEVISKQGSKWVLKSKKTGKVLGTHDSKAQALAQERAIQIAKHAHR